MNRVSSFIISGAPLGFVNLASINEDYLHDNNFDAGQNCPAKMGGSFSEEKACCGSQPDRYPYNTNVKQCCPDNTLATIGMC